MCGIKSLDSCQSSVFHLSQKSFKWTSCSEKAVLVLFTLGPKISCDAVTN